MRNADDILRERKTGVRSVNAPAVDIYLLKHESVGEGHPDCDGFSTAIIIYKQGSWLKT